MKSLEIYVNFIIFLEQLFFRFPRQFILNSNLSMTEGKERVDGTSLFCK